MAPDDKLVLMMNQIVRNLAIQGEARTIEAAADHIRRFWDPRMRERIIAREAAGGAGLDPLARAAVERLAEGRAA